jgi:hypothetical protein
MKHYQTDGKGRDGYIVHDDGGNTVTYLIKV